MWEGERKSMTNALNYGSMMNKAMQFFVQQVLREISENGLPGEHHFFITLDTTHEGLEMASWLFERYPEEITIVMQKWFDNLEVNDAGFAVTLNFGNNPEHLNVPYGAITTFVDPSVEFGVRFENTDGSKDSEFASLSRDQGAKHHAPIKQDQQDEDNSAKSETAKDTKAEIVSLDAFRKT